MHQSKIIILLLLLLLSKSSRNPTEEPHQKDRHQIYRQCLEKGTIKFDRITIPFSTDILKYRNFYNYYYDLTFSIEC
jgi:hypothetical protein